MLLSGPISFWRTQPEPLWDVPEYQCQDCEYRQERRYVSEDGYDCCDSDNQQDLFYRAVLLLSSERISFSLAMWSLPGLVHFHAIPFTFAVPTTGLCSSMSYSAGTGPYRFVIQGVGHLCDSNGLRKARVFCPHRYCRIVTARTNRSLRESERKQELRGVTGSRALSD